MQFVALDGEAINGKYCLLQDSQGGELFSLDGLGTKQTFLWLLKRHLELEELAPVFVGFVTTYDCNMMFRDIDDETLKKIFANDDKDFVRWENYEILYIPRKVFKLRCTIGNDKFGFTLYDVFTFFGSSFVKACAGDLKHGKRRGNLIVTGEGFLGEIRQEIVSGKIARSDFKKKDLARIRRYNQLEVEWLVKLCDKLNEIFLSQGMKITKWHGPGAVAEYVLGKRGLNVHSEYPVYLEEQVPISLWEAWDCAYYGGRFENMGIGTFRDVYSYDINSAYPFAMSQLCVLDYGSRWTRQLNPRRMEHGPQAVYLVEWELKNVPFGPFPWRDRQHRIYYPLNGLGWLWEAEVSAALANPLFAHGIKLREVWFQNTGEPSIFQREIPRLYELRNRLKREGNPGEYALKIALNSGYGKLAQKVGRSPFKCIPWAGMITSHSRAMLLRATQGKEQSILSFATDAVFSREKLNLPLSKALGDWKQEKAKKLLIVMSGFYRWDDVTKKRKSATRGLPPVKEKKEQESDVIWEDIIEGLNRDQTFSYEFTQFITHSMALHFPNKFKNDRLKFIKNTKTLSPFEHTRRYFKRHKLKDWNVDNIMSQPVRFPTRELSHPSSLPFASVTIEEEEQEL